MVSQMVRVRGTCDAKRLTQAVPQRRDRHARPTYSARDEL